MKIFIKDLKNIADEKVIEVNITQYDVNNNIFLRSIKDVKGDITFYYDQVDELRMNYQIQGQMICPDAYTLLDVSLDFDLTDDINVVFKEDEDGFLIYDEEKLEDVVLHLILPEVPIKVEKSEKIEYSSGDGWSFVSEEDYESSSKNKIDPRLQKLKDYKIEED